MREIKYPPKEWETPNTNKRCPKCNGEMREGFISCPDGKPGCCVAHYGYVCLKCGTIFQD